VCSREFEWSGREDSNLRPLGPERALTQLIPNVFIVFWTRVATVATRSGSVRRFRQPPPPIDDTAGGAKMVWAMNYQDRIVRDPQIVGGEPV
jgi:hypothetical protein